MGITLIAPSAPPAGAEGEVRPDLLPEWSVAIPYSIETLSWSHADMFGSVSCEQVWFAVFDGDTWGASTIPGTPNPTEDVRYVWRQNVVGLPPVPSQTFSLGIASHTYSRGGLLTAFPETPTTFTVTEGRSFNLLIGHIVRYDQNPREDNFCTTGVLPGDDLARMEGTTLWTIDPVDPPGPVPPVVNSIGDAPATDPATMGCDTGGTIGSEPECTLRAAIETVNATDNDEITFDIVGGGVPTITVDAALPAVTSGAMIDGTTQGAGFVRVVGGTYDGTALTLGGEPSSVMGLNIDQFTEGVLIESGNGHVVDGNLFGTDGTGAALGDLRSAVESLGDAGVDVAGNTMACGSFCITLQGTSASTVVGNDIGVGPGGGLLETGNGILLFGAEMDVRDNVVVTTGTGIALIGQETAGSTIIDNRIGVTRAGADVSGGERGIRVEGAPAVTVSGNVVATRGTAGPNVGGIEVTGSVQAYQVEGVDDDGNATFRTVFPSLNDVGGGAVTGDGAMITNNVVGLLADGVTSATKQPVNGVIVWAGASNVTIDGNVIAPQDGSALELIGGSGHRVVNNDLGVEAAAGSERGATIGIGATGVSELGVGAGGAGNTIVARAGAVVSESTDVTVVDNVVDAVSIGISGTAVSGLAVGAPGAGNTVTAAGGVVLSESTDVAVVDNVIEAVSIAIAADQDTTGLTVRGNTLFGARTGIASTAESTVIENNRVGINPAGDVVPGQRFGMIVEADNAVINDNTVVGSSENAISALLANPQLRGNEIYDTSKLPIATRRQAPEIIAVIDASPATSDQTLLLVGGMTLDSTGTIEVFANDSCDDGGGEARYVLDLIATKKPNQAWAIVPMAGRGDRDSFTVTYTFTDGSGGTSVLSNCVDRAPGVDADGDGSPDLIEELFNTDDDAQAAVVVTDGGDLLLLETDTGSLAGVGIVDDPAPGAHPGGFSLPHGVIGFEVDDVVPGGGATVVLRSLDDDSPIQGDGYWKHGPRPGTTSTGWYRFDFDEDTNTGARLEIADDGNAFSRVWQINLVDGGRGDSDRLENGTISDPGGPAIEADTSASTTTTTQPASGAATTTQPVSGAATTTVVAAAATLPATGTGTRGSLTLGILFLAVGLGAISLSSRRRPDSGSPPAAHR